VVGDAADAGPVGELVGHLGQVGLLELADGVPGLEEVHHQRTPAEAVQRDRAAVDGGYPQGGGGLAPGHGDDLGRRAAAGGANVVVDWVAALVTGPWRRHARSSRSSRQVSQYADGLGEGRLVERYYSGQALGALSELSGHAAAPPLGSLPTTQVVTEDGASPTIRAGDRRRQARAT
jgi:hypothetical protein